jgi:putative molybdopterin biosynthesis protein
MTAMPEMMTTREVAEYLRIKERKIYDLVRERRIPCARVTGKWLFPKALIDLWVLQGSEGPVSADIPPPSVVAGSHDPLLEFALRESGSPLALLPGGSLDGLARLARREVMVAALHVLDEETGEYNVPMVRAALEGRNIVAIEWARRRQGLILPAGNPKRIAAIPDLAAKGVRVVPRQEGAGSQILLELLMARSGVDPSAVGWVAPPARTETDVGLAVQEERADVGLGLEAAAAQFKLDFVPLQEERMDLILARRDYFEPTFQDLLAFTRREEFRKRAATMGGYDIGGLGTVRYNAP